MNTSNQKLSNQKAYNYYKTQLDIEGSKLADHYKTHGYDLSSKQQELEDEVKLGEQCLKIAKENLTNY